MKSHAIAFYGTTRTKKTVQITYKQRYHIKRSDNVRQRYWKKVTARRSVYVKGGQRLTVYGTPQELEQVKQKIATEKWIPKHKYVDRVSAEVFLRKPRKFAKHGKWVKFEEQET